ncbi:MAG: hypothetical protein GY704_00070, partial [Phycisphaeraceae bacterium]|nr:hypothetical protein [Phycisphaeraceae bacterium]
MTGDDTGDRTIPVVENRKAPNPSVQAAPTEPAEIDEASSSAPSPPALESPEFPQTETGARDAAVAYLEMTEDAVALAPADAAAVQRSIATSDFAEQFGAETEQKMIELTETVPGGVVLRIAPIGVRSVADGEEWLVSVWYAQAITMVGEAVV